VNASHPPIHTHPLLGEVFELLHRMELCQSEPFVWMARDAIKKLRKYEDAVRTEARNADRS